MTPDYASVSICIDVAAGDLGIVVGHCGLPHPPLRLCQPSSTPTPPTPHLQSLPLESATTAYWNKSQLLFPVGEYPSSAVVDGRLQVVTYGVDHPGTEFPQYLLVGGVWVGGLEGGSLG